MLEAPVENRLKKLEDYGFKVSKFVTPGRSGSQDRIIYWPKWSPAPPVFVEIKRPGKKERPLQAAVRDDMKARGCDVRDMCDTYEKIDHLVETLFYEARGRVL